MLASIVNYVYLIMYSTNLCGICRSSGLFLLLFAVQFKFNIVLKVPFIFLNMQVQCQTSARIDNGRN